MFKYSVLEVGMVATNCYFVFNDQDKTLYIIDPGADAAAIIKQANKYDFEQLFVLLTHAHVDHISALGEITQKLNVQKIYLNENDLHIYESKNNHLMPFLPLAKNLPAVDCKNNFTDFEIIETPGHTPGGVCFYFKAIPAVFVGDTLFASSIGRTDLPGGDTETLLASIKEKLLGLNTALTVCPGHGEPTTIGREKKSNPFL